MPYKRRKARKTRRRTTRRTSKRPVGYTRVRGGYALVFRRKGKLKLGSKFKTKTGLMKKARALLKRKR